MEQNLSEGSDNEIDAKDEIGFITDPKQYLQFCKKDKKIKIMDECNPIMNNVYLKDISLHKKGPLQDKIYSKIPKYYKNIRRGNTLCEIYENNQPKELFFCRRGMLKFYDLQPQYLKVNAQLTYQHARYRKVIFQELDKCLNTGEYTIHLYRLFKQNGQHCQISYIHQLKYWLFASKNVSILAKDQEDLKNHYHKQRFYWAKLIGDQFFKMLRQFSPQQKQQFIEEIKGKTLLGEHCGNQNHQHITTYQNVQIIFYAIVQNVGSTHCLPVQYCQTFLKKYKLKMSKIKSIKNLKNKTSVYESMYELLEEVAKGSMQIQGQGSVLYIVAQKEGVQRTVSLCKLKTSEYLIFRKLREMLKINATKKGSTANSFEKFKFDIQNLTEKYFKPPQSLQAYFKVAEAAFKEVLSNQDITETYLRYKFAGFISEFNQSTKNESEKLGTQQKFQVKRVIIISLPSTTSQIQKYLKTIKVQFDYNLRIPDFQNQKENIVNLLYMIPRLPAKLPTNCRIIIRKYTVAETQQVIKQFQNFTNISKSHLITFVKSTDKAKSIQMLQQKIISFEQQCIKNNIPYILIEGNNKNEKTMEKLDEIFANKQQVNTNEKNDYRKPKKYLILPMLIPGSGKSTFNKHIQQFMKNQHKNIPFRTISSDEIRKQIIQKMQKQSSNVNQQMKRQQGSKWYQLSKNQAAEAYKNAIQIELNRVPMQNQIIFIDRVFCPTTIQSNLKDFHRQYTQIVIITQTFNSFKLNTQAEYCFSMKYVLTSLYRCLQRQVHQTLTTNPDEIVKVVLKFYQMYKNFNFGKVIKSLPQQLGHINVIQFDFVEEDRKGVNVFLKKKLQQCLSNIQPGYDPKQSGAYTELIELMYKNLDYLKENVQENHWQQKCIKLWKNISLQ